MPLSYTPGSKSAAIVKVLELEGRDCLHIWCHVVDGLYFLLFPRIDPEPVGSNEKETDLD